MATGRFKSPTMKFGVRLSVPGSRTVERCYAMDGAGYAHGPADGAVIDVVLINALRQLWTASGTHPRRHVFRKDAVGRNDGWRILGWRMADGSMPLGEYDAVDPELAQFDYLPCPNPDVSCSDASPRPDSGRPVHPCSEGMSLT